MSTNDWQNDKVAASVFLLLAFITAWISQYWLGSFFVWTLAFFLWKYIELRRFFQWYKNGASETEVPLNNGIFEVLTTLVLHNKKQVTKANKRNQYLLQQFETTAQALPFATVLLDAQNEIQWSNQSAIIILSVRPNDKNQKIDNIIRNPSFIKLLNNDEKDQTLKINHPSDIEKKIKIRLIHLNKHRQLLVANDISAQESLQQSRKAFVANASHELRTPLTVITGYLEMIQSSGQITDDWAAAISQALEQSNRMEQIIDDMLKLATIEHDRHITNSNNEVIDMPQLLNKLFVDIKNSSQAKQHQFSAQIDSSLYIEGNPSEITSVCLNLLRNAVIHTAPGTKVLLRWFLGNDQRPHLWIVDDGEGIDNKHIPHLTERFYRVDNSKTKNIHSTGLGLAIVKHICLKHSASFDITSQKGQGTTFKIIFPYAVQRP